MIIHEMTQNQYMQIHILRKKLQTLKLGESIIMGCIALQYFLFLVLAGAGKLCLNTAGDSSLWKSSG